MVVSAQPVTPSFGNAVAIGWPSAFSALAWYGQALEAATPSFLKSLICTVVSCQ
ncbi:hypothetical protein D3C78_610390 [compost metagenome]